MNKILIGCKSGWQFDGRRERCLNTWMIDIDLFCSTQIDYVFSFGVNNIPAAQKIGHCLFLPCPNEYEYLPKRMRLFCQWAITLEWWDYLFCTDDDTRICAERLVNYDTHGADYIGPEWKRGVGYASGGGHFLSRRAAEVVAERLIENVGHDDLLVGRHLAESGIKLTVDNERFRVLMPLDAEPGHDNNWVYSTPAKREPR
jgi:hypothetical protein